MHTEPDSVRILLVDDHPIVRAGIATCLQEQPSYEIVGEASSGKEALEKIAAINPEIVLMDLSLPDMSGLETTRLIRKSMPDVAVIVLTMHDTKEYILELMRLGARGFLLKDSPPTMLTEAIDRVHAGGTYFHSSHTQMLLDDMFRKSRNVDDKSEELTEREREVLVLIAEGKSNKEIAAALFLSVRTIESHRENIMRKLDIHSVAGLTRYALSVGLIRLS